MISKTVRNIWTLSTLVIAFLLLKGWLSFTSNVTFTEVFSYNFMLVASYLYGKEGVKNVMPIIELWLNKYKPPKEVKDV